MQATIKKIISFEGIGIHTGTYGKMVVMPAPENTGIVFNCNGHSIPASIDYVCDTIHGVNLKHNNIEIKSCEHILSTLYGMGITNAIIELIEGKEIPAMDGSSKAFVESIEIATQTIAKRVVKPTEPIFMTTKDSAIFLSPADEFKISFVAEYNYPGFTPQYKSLVISPEVYANEIAPSRTYTFTGWVENLKKQGLIQGGSMENALIMDENGALNGLRFPDEPVRHKMLDIIGDIALAGVSLKCWIFGIKSGHSLNCELARRLKCSLI
ncbi:MAG: UDP-3-O-acyl-N-acetylglucosamine deacetylase [bacterium]